MLKQADLYQFIGSQCLYRHPLFRGINYTEGCHHLMENGAAWLVEDTLAVVLHTAKLRSEPFLVVEIAKEEDGSAKYKITDGNDGVLYTKSYTYADLGEVKEIKFFITDNVMMLISEY